MHINLRWQSFECKTYCLNNSEKNTPHSRIHMEYPNNQFSSYFSIIPQFVPEALSSYCRNGTRWSILKYNPNIDIEEVIKSTSISGRINFGVYDGGSKVFWGKLCFQFCLQDTSTTLLAPLASNEDEGKTIVIKKQFYITSKFIFVWYFSKHHEISPIEIALDLTFLKFPSIKVLEFSPIATLQKSWTCCFLSSN